MWHVQWFFLLRSLLVDLSTMFGYIIGILDYCRHFDCSRPVVIIETLEISSLLDLITGQVSSVLDQNVPGWSSSSLVHILCHHKELPVLCMDYLWIHYCSRLTVAICRLHFLLSSLCSSSTLHRLVSWWICIRNIKLVLNFLVHHYESQLRFIWSFDLLTHDFDAIFYLFQFFF